MNSKSKIALKTLVKECLIELLAEGLVGNKKQATLRETREFRGAMQETYERSENRQISERSLTEVQSSQVTKARPATHRKNSYLDSIKMGIDNSTIEEKQQIKKKVSGITDDPIMSDILADTAMTTLREQKETRGSGGSSIMVSGDKAAKIVNQSSPEDLFGGQANKWADLAFASPIRK